MNYKQSIDEFIKTLPYKEKTLANKRRQLLRFSNFIEEEYKLSDCDWHFDKVVSIKFGDKEYRIPVNQATISNFLKYLNDSTSASSYNDILTTIRKFFDYLMDNGVLADNPAYDIKPKKIIHKDMTNHRLTFDEALALLVGSFLLNKHIARNYALTLMLLSAPIRIGEALILEEKAIISEKELIYAYGKSGHRRRLLTPALIDTFNVLLKDPLRLEALKYTPKKYLFYSDKGGPLTTEEANSILKNVAQVMGITKNITTYYLRRTYATLLAQSGFSITEIQNIFDHDRTKNTKRYVLETNNIDIRNMMNDNPISDMLRDTIRSTLRIKYIY